MRTRRKNKASENESGTSILDLPWEVLLKIFLCACRVDGRESCRIASVCKAWRGVSRMPEVWVHANLSRRSGCTVSDANILELTHAGCWSTLTKLKLKGSHVTGESLDSVASHCHALVDLDLSDCERIPWQSLVNFLVNCSQLQRLLLSRWQEPPTTAELAGVPSTLPNLQEIKLKGSWRRRPMHGASPGSLLLRALSKGIAPNLRVLDLSWCCIYVGFSLPLAQLQRSCRKLEVLRLNMAAFYVGWDIPLQSQPKAPRYSGRRGRPGEVAPPATEEESEARPLPPGFPELRELTLAATSLQTEGMGTYDHFPAYANITKSVLWWIAGPYTKLETVDVSGCRRLDPWALQGLNADSLRVLRSGRGGACDAASLARWGHSLEELDLRSNTAFHADVFNAIAINCRVLTRLDLSGTALTVEGLTHILSGRPGSTLQWVNTIGCRGLPFHLRLFDCLEAAREKLLGNSHSNCDG